MGTKIEWTNETWNPTTGCTEVSPGCDNCYARELAHGRLNEVYSRTLPVLPEKADDPFAVRLWPDRLDKPRSWSQHPRMIFVNSMSDLFHNEIPFNYVAQVFDEMMEHDMHTYQVLTKRPALAAKFWRKYMRGPMPPHIWIGTSIENADFTYRAGQLFDVDAEVRFLSCEPLLGPLYNLDLTGIHWVIAGGESGPNYRAMNLDHARSLRDECQACEVPFFFKQVGGRTPKAGGCELDGREWKEFPADRGTPTPEEG